MLTKTKNRESNFLHKKDDASVRVATILAAGKGKRLALFETIKPLVVVAGKPLILWSIERLQEVGVKKIYIVANRERRQIERKLLEYPQVVADIEYVEHCDKPETMLNSFLALKNMVSEPMFVTACDLIFDKNPLVRFRPPSPDTLTAGVFVGPNDAYGRASGAQVKVLHQNDVITGIGRTIKTYNAFETGIYYVTPKAYSALRRFAEKRPLIRSLDKLFSVYGEKGRIASFLLQNIRWFDVNTPASVIQAELLLREDAMKTKQSQAVPYTRAKPKTTVTFQQERKISFDVHIQRHLVDNLERYEIIPYELYRSPHYLLVDKNIDNLYGRKIHKKLTNLGYQVRKIIVEPGEWSKSFENFKKLSSEILSAGIDKKSTIISLGGGVIKDIAGFLASTLYRGIGFISIPTTVLSQCDAAIALKQGINGEGGKNLIGSYYAPLKVIVDPALLLTLPERYIRDGLAECLKQALAQDKAFYNYFLNHSSISFKDMDFLEYVVRKSIKLKITSIQEDVHEEREALVNQYGHEIGHAIEYLSGYELGHGESVAIGMRVSAELARIIRVSDEQTRVAHASILKKYGLPCIIPRAIKPEDILNMLRYHKKNHGGETRMTLVASVGSLWRDRNQYTLPISDALLAKAITRSYGV